MYAIHLWLESELPSSDSRGASGDVWSCDPGSYINHQQRLTRGPVISLLLHHRPSALRILRHGCTVQKTFKPWLQHHIYNHTSYTWVIFTYKKMCAEYTHVPLHTTFFDREKDVWITERSKLPSSHQHCKRSSDTPNLLLYDSVFYFYTRFSAALCVTDKRPVLQGLILSFLIERQP